MRFHISIKWLWALFLLFPAASWGKTLVVEGKLNGTVTVRKNVTFSSERPLTMVSYQIPIPATYDAAGNLQRLDDFEVTSSPEPTEIKEITDSFGNRYRTLIWRNLKGDARTAITYTTSITARIASRTSSIPFPLQKVSEQEQVFLKKSKLVQSDDPQVMELARQLTTGAVTEHQAVSEILTYVADAITFQYNPKRYDALFALTTGSGNCQNFSHLALALLRASGIPARISIGQSLKEKWRIPLDNHGSSLVQGMGEGLHAWIEVYYPDQGWLPCDPQQSRLFTSTRHIKFGHGLDANDVQEFWKGSPDVPQMSESFEATYLTDIVDLRLLEAVEKPTHYLVAGEVFSLSAPPESTPPTRVKSKPEPPTSPKPTPPLPALPALEPPPAKLRPKAGTPVEIGNREFPALVEVYHVEGNIGRKSFDRETAEYATSKYLYAQAFTIDAPLTVQTVSLAMRRFGGDGMVYLDLVTDEAGNPSMNGVRSLPVSLERITRKPGYYWVDFTLPEGSKLKSGKYWIVLRHSGEAIMNWFYTPGKRVGGPDDTRSTARGWQWEDVLAGELVYRVQGVVE
jgi:transglutaminase-like putative cysteine protease